MRLLSKELFRNLITDRRSVSTPIRIWYNGCSYPHDRDIALGSGIRGVPHGAPAPHDDDGFHKLPEHDVAQPYVQADDEHVPPSLQRH